MEYKSLTVDNFLTSRIPPMLVSKIIGLRNSLNMNDYPSDSNQYTKHFIEKVTSWIKSSKLNNIENLESLQFTDAILGVSQQIDELHYKYGNKLVIFDGEYAYHWRLNPSILKVSHYSNIPASSVLVMSYPSVKTAGNIENMCELLDFCYKHRIEVHIDAAWLGQCRNIKIDLSHPAIKTFSVSLSKAYSMGSQRIGVRYSREHINGPINIMNNFGYNNISDMWIGSSMIDTLGPDFWWKSYNTEYIKVCTDFALKETDSINIANYNGVFVSIRTPLRFLIDNRFDSRGYNV
jgi:hypothetical protein